MQPDNNTDRSKFVAPDSMPERLDESAAGTPQERTEPASYSSFGSGPEMESKVRRKLGAGKLGAVRLEMSEDGQAVCEMHGRADALMALIAHAATVLVTQGKAPGGPTFPFGG